MIFRWLAISLFVVLFTAMLPAGRGPAQGEELIEHHGLILGYGCSAWTNVGPDARVDYQWTTAGYLLSKDIVPWFSLESQIGAGYLKADNGGDSPSVELRILGNFHYKWLFMKLGCGVAHVFNAEALPGLAETKAHSIVSGALGFRFPLDPVEITLGYWVEHISAISKNGSEGDTGWNVGGPKVAITWRF